MPVFPLTVNMPCGVRVVTAYESIPSGISEGSHI